MVKFEETFFGDSEGWDEILDFLGLSRRPRPPGAWQVGDEKTFASQIRRKLDRVGVTERAGRFPAPLRAAGRHVVGWADERNKRRQKAASNVPIPDASIASIIVDQRELEKHLPGTAHMVSDL